MISIIQYDSNQSFSQKVSYFNSVFNRVERVPLINSNFENELNVIYKLEIKNNFDIKTINNIHEKIRNKLQQNPINILSNNNNKAIFLFQ